MKPVAKILFLTALAISLAGSAQAANWYAEASPTYMQTSQKYVVSAGDIHAKETAKLYGIMFAGGYQINQWSQAQVDVGYLTASKSEIDVSNYNWPTLKRDSKWTVIPVLASYNFTWQFVNNWTLKVGPTVGYSYVKADKQYQDSFTYSSFSYGANAAIQWDVSSKVYVQVGAKYLVINSSDKVDTLSLSAGVGYKF